MKTSKTNVSVVDNLGKRIVSNIMVGESTKFRSGDIMDANAVNDAIEQATGDGKLQTTQPYTIVDVDIDNEGNVSLNGTTEEDFNALFYGKSALGWSTDTNSAVILCDGVNYYYPCVDDYAGFALMSHVHRTIKWCCPVTLNTYDHMTMGAGMVITRMYPSEGVSPIFSAESMT